MIYSWRWWILPKNKDKNTNETRNRNNNQNPNDMREEFGTAFDVNKFKEQNNIYKTRNKDLDPGMRNF